MCFTVRRSTWTNDLLQAYVCGTHVPRLNLVKTWSSVNVLWASILEWIASGSNICVCILPWKYFLSFRGILQTLSELASIPGYLQIAAAPLPTIHFRRTAEWPKEERASNGLENLVQWAMEFFIFNSVIKQYFWQHRKLDTCLLSASFEKGTMPGYKAMIYRLRSLKRNFSTDSVIDVRQKVE